MTTKLTAQTGTTLRVKGFANTGPSHMVTLHDGQLCMEGGGIRKGLLVVLFSEHCKLDRLEAHKK